jgi:hypothetical protein
VSTEPESCGGAHAWLEPHAHSAALPTIVQGLRHTPLKHSRPGSHGMMNAPSGDTHDHPSGRTRVQ